MKIWNSNISTLFLLILLLACNKRDEPLIVDENACIQFIDTTGLNLYYFAPFTEYEWKYESYDYKVQRRQLPDEVLKSSSMEQLFNQCVSLDMASEMLLFNSYQAGFREFYHHFNVIQELYKREGVHVFLEEKLKNIDAANFTTNKCRFYNILLEYMYVQQECLVHYSKNEIIRCLDVLFEKNDRASYLTTIDNQRWVFWDLGKWMIGIGNVMIINEYKPFLDELEKDVELNSFFATRIEVTENVVVKVLKFGNEFYNKLKNETK